MNVVFSNQDSILNNGSQTNSGKLIFIYNASDDGLSIAFDFIHKIVSPSTYQCSLCKVTYGNTKMHKQWKDYIDNCSISMEFLYKNNYLENHKNLKVNEFPVAYLYDGKTYQIFISKEEFDSLEHLDQLINIVEGKLKSEL